MDQTKQTESQQTQTQRTQTQTQQTQTRQTQALFGPATLQNSNFIAVVVMTWVATMNF